MQWGSLTQISVFEKCIQLDIKCSWLTTCEVIKVAVLIYLHSKFKVKLIQ